MRNRNQNKGVKRGEKGHRRKVEGKEIREKKITWSDGRGR